MEQSFARSKFSQKANRWREVKDFNWMKQGRSPNFELAEEAPAPPARV